MFWWKEKVLWWKLCWLWWVLGAAWSLMCCGLVGKPLIRKTWGWLSSDLMRRINWVQLSVRACINSFNIKFESKWCYSFNMFNISCSTGNPNPVLANKIFSCLYLCSQVFMSCFGKDLIEPDQRRLTSLVSKFIQLFPHGFSQAYFSHNFLNFEILLKI